VSLTKAIILAFIDIFRQLFVSRTVPEDVSGPVGIAVIAGRIAKQGFTPFLQFAGMLSVNLAVINFLPIPALDGGRALFLVIEKLRRKPLSRKLEIGIHNVAFLLLILLIILVTVRDLSRYGGVIVDGVKGIAGM
jgi:regulator of sigma E protease